MEKANDIINYDRIAKAITYIRNNFKYQPKVKDIANEVNLSAYHFQRIFTDWAGVSPKSFLQYTSIEYAKQILKNSEATLFDAAFETGLSGTGRLHDLFIKIEGMTPAEYKNGGKNLIINFSFNTSPFGNIIIASTQKGICYMGFYENEEEALINLTSQFPNASFIPGHDTMQERALQIFKSKKHSNLDEIKLHLKGTDFQLKVWQSLLKIPTGNLANYQVIAGHIGKLSSSRAVGNAIEKNPVAYLIPCHRVIRVNGEVGGYMWGNERKGAIIGWEAAQLDSYK
ncbi:methylated-DNA--[protein]-cysteine S-methyltransferase [Flavobacterium sp. MK4S-17]|uniref:bifunctional helix-turn-helix domain-containing protein/methylated-DNA--[protein]-cysteine S-methyltransferase n=1 Tax=Flavobacterium sp. MK4S-17 TaxID=2543737 RepID=UPI00135774C6|nr:methylated-DNA--[protein]-cysteine S-methyltransferase [Flavobacterium sp. MK4S-17]